MKIGRALLALAACGSHASPQVESDAAATADAVPIAPTASSWLGTNVAADLARVDVAYQLAAFDTPTDQKDPNGCPIAGAAGTSSTDVGYLLPSGTYKIYAR